MRISTNQFHEQSLARILALQEQTAETQQQISTGRRFLTPADDPLAAERVERANRELAVREQYGRNIDLAESELRNEDAALEQAIDLLQRVRELAVQAGNPAYSEADRRFIAAEVASRTDEMMALMNTRLASGDYLFGGTAGGAPPFVLDASGAVRYEGDEGQRGVQIDATTRIPVNDSGKRVFVDVPSASLNAKATPHPGNAAGGTGVVAPPRVADPTALEALYPDGLVIEFEALDTNGLPSFTVTRRSDGRVLEGMTGVPYTPGEVVSVAGLELEIYGNPRPGDRFLVETSSRQDVLMTMGKLADGLRTLPATGPDDGAFQALIADSLTDLDAAANSILEVRSEIGARMGVMDSTRALHEHVTLLSTELKSELQDLDYAEAISNLSRQSFVLEAALQSFAEVARLSLFDAI